MNRPAFSFYTKEQILKSAFRKIVAPAYVIEIISEEQELVTLEKMLIDCFQAGVQAVWRIIPEIKTISVYTSPKTVTICTDDDVIIADPVMPDMTLSVNELVKI